LRRQRPVARAGRPAWLGRLVTRRDGPVAARPPAVRPAPDAPAAGGVVGRAGDGVAVRVAVRVRGPARRLRGCGGPVRTGGRAVGVGPADVAERGDDVSPARGHVAGY